MKGRKPKVTALHELHGTVNVTKHARRKLEPEAVGELFEAPEWLTESQQAGWRYAVANAPRGVLRRIDRGMLAVWVEAEDRHRVAITMQAQLDRGSTMPLLTKNRDGTVGISPYLSIATRAAAVLMKCASELGFSPASRPRLAGATGGPRDIDARPAHLDDEYADPSVFDRMRRLQLVQGGRK
jgi:P27 family predicted phage terminase small subunit